MANSTTGNGMGIGTILFLIFLVLKLTKVITWSWWWVAAPLWLPLTIVIVCFVGGLDHYSSFRGYGITIMLRDYFGYILILGLFLTISVMLNLAPQNVSNRGYIINKIRPTTVQNQAKYYFNINKPDEIVSFSNAYIYGDKDEYHLGDTLNFLSPCEE